MSKEHIKISDGVYVGVERGPNDLWRITMNGGKKVTGCQTDNPKTAREFAIRSARELVEKTKRQGK